MSDALEIQTWLTRLDDADPQAQVAALAAWVRHPRAADAEAEPVWRAVERLALQAASPQVREAAVRALNTPAARAHYARRPRRSSLWRHELRAEIQTWAQEGLITPEQAAVLMARYADPPRRKPQPSVSAPPDQRRTFPWALHVVLYLGAFFVIAAALLFASVVRAWRLPILLAATVVFAVGALVVYRLTPQGGRVLGIVAAGFLWADAAVLGKILEPHLAADGRALYWAVATLLLALVWLAGAWALRIGVLHVAAWPMLAASLVYGLTWLEGLGLYVQPSWAFFAWAAELLLALGWVILLKRRQPRTALWLFGMSHLVAGFLLFATALFATEEPWPGPQWVRWEPALGAYILLLGFYLLGRWKVRPVPWIEIWAVPLTVLGMVYTWTHLWPSGWPQASALTLAAAGVSLAAWAVRRARWKIAGAWSVGLEIVALLAWTAAGILFQRDTTIAAREVLALAPWMLGAAWGWALALTSRRWVPAVGGWLLLLVGYVHFVDKIWPATPRLYWPGWLLVPVLVSVALDALGHRLHNRPVQTVGRGGAFALAGSLGLAMFTQIGQADFRDAGMLLALTGLWAGYAWALRRDVLWAGIPPLFTFTWGLFLDALDAYHPALWSIWPVGAALIGWVMGRARPSLRWTAWGWGTLAVAWLAGLLAFFYDDGWSVLTLAMMATVTGGFAWLWRQVFLVLPTALLYLGAYTWTLHLWHVRQPQVYTIPAAAMGLLLHGLYRRWRHRVVSFVLGVLSQLVLFTTTYVQMVDHRSGWYFGMLFLQALVVLGYGLWSNDPALIWTPIGFVVAATATMLLIRFQGLGVLALLCLSGLALLAGGLFFLWRRARAEGEAASPEAQEN